MLRPLALIAVTVSAALPGAISAQAFGIAVAALWSAKPVTVELAGFQGRIPTEGSPIWGERRLAEMQRTGRLPDTFTRSGCRYNLAGDPAVAYYVKECDRR